jgi:hypothetical protein
MPEGVAENRHTMASPGVLAVEKVATERRRDAEQAEEIRAAVGALDALGLEAGAGDVEVGAEVRREPLEGLVLIAPVTIVGQRAAAGGNALRDPRGPEEDETIGLGIRERLQENGVDEAVDRAVDFASDRRLRLTPHAAPASAGAS